MAFGRGSEPPRDSGWRPAVYRAIEPLQKNGTEAGVEPGGIRSFQLRRK